MQARKMRVLGLSIMAFVLAVVAVAGVAGAQPVFPAANVDALGSSVLGCCCCCPLVIVLFAVIIAFIVLASLFFPEFWMDRRAHMTGPVTPGNVSPAGYCTKCGAPFGAGDVYCTKCGNKL